jgi:aminoglycoside phosphotransferase
MESLPHSYTNHTVLSDHVVVKSYQGPDAARRCSREAAALSALADALPVPALLSASGTVLRMSWMPGVHGQDLIAAGHAERVLRVCGKMLRRIQAVDPLVVFGAANSDAVLVHGDYGPNNLLLDPDAGRVMAIVDWEWVHPGNPIEDLAWCEWIIRMHHGGEAGALTALFDGYGHRPAWGARHEAMIIKCLYHLDLAKLHEPGSHGVTRWQEFLDVTRNWSE